MAQLTQSINCTILAFNNLHHFFPWSFTGRVPTSSNATYQKERNLLYERRIIFLKILDSEGLRKYETFLRNLSKLVEMFSYKRMQPLQI